MSHTTKVAIFSNPGPKILPEILEKELPSDLLNARIELAVQLSQLPDTHSTVSFDVGEQLFSKEQTTKTHLAYKKPATLINNVAIKTPLNEKQVTATIEIVSVDSSRPWRIEKIEGCEEIVYI